MVAEFPDKLKPFRHHGVSFTFVGGQGVADCPFCDGPKKLYADPETGKYDCKKCGDKGNVYTFLKQFHAQLLENTTDHDYKELSNLRKGIDWRIFKQVKFARDGKEWVAPIYSPQGKLVNLDTWSGPGSPWFGTAGLSVHLYGAEIFDDPENELLKDPDTLFCICEGKWDAIALASILDSCEQPIVVLAVPGAGTFKQDWVQFFQNRRVAILFDNDEAGRKGTTQVVKKLSPVVKSLLVLNWPNKTKNGEKDLNDFIAARLDDPAGAIEELLAMLGNPLGGHETNGHDHSAPEKPAKRIFKTRPTWQQVIKEYRRILHTTPQTENAIALCFATIFSNQIKTPNPIWLFIVGPSGSGKTMLLMSLASCDNCYYLSKLRTQLVSGVNAPDGSDPSTLKKMLEKVNIIEDLTPNLSMPKMVQDEMWGTMRQVYGGRVDIDYHNGIKRHYDNTFSLIAGVTSIINSFSQTEMGERFVKAKFLDRDSHDEFSHIAAALSPDPIKKKADQERLCQVAREFTDYVVNTKKLPRINKEHKHRLIRLGIIVTYLRSTVKRDHYDNIVYKNEREIGTRITAVLEKTAVSLAITYGKRAIDDGIIRQAEELAMGTVQGYFLDVAAILMAHNPHYLNADVIAFKLGSKSSSVHRWLQDMLELKIVVRERLPHKGPGQPPWGYKCHPDFVDLWLRAKVSTSRLTPRHKPVSKMRKVQQK